MTRTDPQEWLTSFILFSVAPTEAAGVTQLAAGACQFGHRLPRGSLCPN